MATTPFGTKVRELRITKAYGLRQAARMAGIDATMWSKLETGARRPPNPALRVEEANRTIRKISEVLKTDEYDPFGDLCALATLPDDSPQEAFESLASHYTRKYKKK